MKIGGATVIESGRGAGSSPVLAISVSVVESGREAGIAAEFVVSTSVVSGDAACSSGCGEVSFGAGSVDRVESAGESGSSAVTVELSGRIVFSWEADDVSSGSDSVDAVESINAVGSPDCSSDSGSAASEDESSRVESIWICELNAQKNLSKWILTAMPSAA